MITEKDKEQLEEITYVLQGRTKPTVACFSVGSYRKRAELVSELERSVPGYKYFTLDLTGQKVFSLYKALVEQVPEEILRSKPVQYIVHVLGLEDSLYISPGGGVRESSLVGELNFERENLFHEFPFCIIIWTTPYFADKLKKEAQDLWDWLTYSYSFEDTESYRITEPTPERFSSFPKGLSPERKDRIQELNEKYRSLDLGGSEPERVIKEKLTIQKLLAHEYESASLFREAIDAYNAALSLYHQLEKKDIATEAELLFKLGWALFETNELASALENMKRSLAAQRALSGLANVGDTYLGIGSVYLKQHRWEESLEAFHSALNAQRAAGDDQRIGGIYHQMGIAYDEQHKWEQALETYRLALEWESKTGNELLLGKTYHEIGSTFARQHRWEEALEYYRLALESHRKAGNDFDIGATYHQIGLVFEQQKKWEESLENYRLAVEWKQKTGNQFELGNSYHQIGIFFHKQGKWEEALDNYQLALSWNQRTGNYFETGRTHHQIGRLFQDQEKWEESLENYWLALEWNTKTGNYFEVAGSYYQIGTIFAVQGLLKEALKNFSSAISFSVRFDEAKTDICISAVRTVLTHLPEDEARPILAAAFSSLTEEDKEKVLARIFQKDVDHPA